MTLLTAVGPLAKSIKGTAELIAGTDQFQLETGKSATLSLEENCYWPHIPLVDRGDGEDQQFITAPLCCVHVDPGQAYNRPYPGSTNQLVTGEVFVQLALIADTGTYTDSRDQYTDLLNRADQIILEALRIASQRTAETQWLTVHSFFITQPPEENDISQVQFQDADGDPIKVHIFPMIAAWSAN
jgi:hypothetical protein